MQGISALATPGHREFAHVAGRATGPLALSLICLMRDTAVPARPTQSLQRERGRRNMRLAPRSASQAEARSAEHRANARRSAAPAARRCDVRSTRKPSWRSVVPHDWSSAMVSDYRGCSMISDDHRSTMITHYEATAIVAAVACCGCVVCGTKNQTGGECESNSGKHCSAGFHGRTPLGWVRSLRCVLSRLCERNHRQNASAFHQLHLSLADDLLRLLRTDNEIGRKPCDRPLVGAATERHPATRSSAP